MATRKQKDQAEAREELRKMLSEGATVYTVLRHVSRSGMQRAIDLFIIRDNEPLRITWTAARALGWSYSDKYEAMKVDGAGMDMGFHAVCNLSYTLFGIDKLKQRWL